MHTVLLLVLVSILPSNTHNIIILHTNKYFAYYST